MSRVLSLECRTRFCRLEIIHESVQVNNDFLASLFSQQRSGPLATGSGGFRGETQSRRRMARGGTSSTLRAQERRSPWTRARISGHSRTRTATRRRDGLIKLVRPFLVVRAGQA